MNESVSPPMMMLSSTHSTISTNAASTAAQPMRRNCRNQVAMTLVAPRGEPVLVVARGSSPTVGAASCHRAMREQPQDDAESNQSDQAVTAQLRGHRDDVGDHAAEERQGAADQQCRDDRQ